MGTILFTINTNIYTRKSNSIYKRRKHDRLACKLVASLYSSSWTRGRRRRACTHRALDFNNFLAVKKRDCSRFALALPPRHTMYNTICSEVVVVVVVVVCILSACGICARCPDWVRGVAVSVCVTVRRRCANLQLCDYEFMTNSLSVDKWFVCVLARQSYIHTSQPLAVSIWDGSVFSVSYKVFSL